MLQPIRVNRYRSWLCRMRNFVKSKQKNTEFLSKYIYIFRVNQKKGSGSSDAQNEPHLTVHHCHLLFLLVWSSRYTVHGRCHYTACMFIGATSSQWLRNTKSTEKKIHVELWDLAASGYNSLKFLYGTYKVPVSFHCLDPTEVGWQKVEDFIFVTTFPCWFTALVNIH